MNISHHEQDRTSGTIFPLSWGEFTTLTGALVHKIEAGPAPEVIVGLQRGGLIPAVMLSHQLEIPTLFSLPIRSTTSDEIYAAKVPPVVAPLTFFEQLQGKRVLVVDDVVGSGATLKVALSVLRCYQPACIQSVVYVVNRDHWNPVNQGAPTELITYIGTECSGWVVFPWEKEVISAQQTGYGADEREGV